MTIPNAVLLAELDGVQYLLIQAPAVLATRGEQLAYYGAGSEWDRSPAGLEAQRRREIADLRARLAELEASGPMLPPAPTVDEPMVDCPWCRKRFRAKGINIHKAKCAQRPVDQVDGPAPVVEVIASTWACAACQRTDGEPALTDPTRCKACVRAANATASAALVATVRPAPAPAALVCAMCGKTFETQRSLDGHIGRMHSARKPPASAASDDEVRAAVASSFPATDDPVDDPKATALS